MGVREELLRWDVRRRAGVEGALAQFRRHYDTLGPTQKRNVYELAAALCRLWGGDGPGSFAARSYAFGDTGEVVLGLAVDVANFSGSPESFSSYRLDPFVLKAAIEHWDRGEDYFPPAKVGAAVADAGE